METVPVKPGAGKSGAEGKRVELGGGPMGIEKVEGGLTLRVKALVTNVTSTKTVAVFTKPGADVPRTLNWVGPKGTVAATCTGKEPAALAATVPGVAWKPAGRLGKSMDTVPVKP